MLIKPQSDNYYLTVASPHPEKDEKNKQHHLHKTPLTLSKQSFSKRLASFLLQRIALQRKVAAGLRAQHRIEAEAEAVVE